MLEQIITYKTLVIIIAIVIAPFTLFMYDSGTFWGLIGIEGVIDGLGISTILQENSLAPIKLSP